MNHCPKTNSNINYLHRLFAFYYYLKIFTILFIIIFKEIEKTINIGDSSIISDKSVYDETQHNITLKLELDTTANINNGVINTSTVNRICNDPLAKYLDSNDSRSQDFDLEAKPKLRRSNTYEKNLEKAEKIEAALMLEETFADDSIRYETANEDPKLLEMCSAFNSEAVLESNSQIQ